MKMVHVVKGNTYPAREELKRLQFQWFAPAKVWWRPWDMDSTDAVQEVQDRIAKLRDVMLIDMDADVMRNAIGGRVDWLNRELAESTTSECLDRDARCRSCGAKLDDDIASDECIHCRDK